MPPKNKATQRETQHDLAREIISANPTITANRTLAKLLHSKYPMQITSIDNARTVVRQVFGKMGKQIAIYTTDKNQSFLERIAKLRAESKIEEADTEDVTPYIISERFKRILVIGDLHIPFQDMKALDLALEYGFNQKVDAVVINGDLLDFGTISKYISKPNAPRMIESIEQGKEVLKYIKDALGCKIIYHAGNHCCYSDETEILTSDGFKKFDDLKHSDLVAQFDSDNNISFALPVLYIKKEYTGTMYDIENNYSRQCVTANHDVVINKEKKKAKDVVISDLKSIPLTGLCNNVDYDMSDDMIRLITWIVMDGSIVDNRKYISNSTKRRIQFKLSKTRKIDAIKDLLERMNIPHTIAMATMSGINKLQPYMIRIYGDWGRELFSLFENGKKQLPDYFRNLSKKQVKIVLDTILETDGSIHDGAISWTTILKSDVDIIQEMCIKNGFAINVKRHVSHGFVNGKLQYACRINLGETSLSVKKITETEYSGIVYCVEMPLGTVITRLHGKTAFSGNCRVENYLIQKAPEFWGLPSVTLEGMLELKKKNIDYVSNIRTMHFGKLVICHGNHVTKGVFSPVNAAKGAWNKAQASIMIGHSHKSSSHISTDIKQKISGSWSVGSLTENTPVYNPQVSGFNQGFAVVTRVDKEGNFTVDNKMIIEYKVR